MFAGLQKVTFDTQDVSEKDQVDYWIDKIEAFFDAKDFASNTETPKGFAGRLDLLQCGDIIFGQVDSDGQTYERKTKRLITDGLDHFIIQIFLEGGGPIDGGETIRPGDMLILDMGRRHARESWPHKTLSFVIPRDRDPGLTRILDNMHERRLPRSHPMVKMVFAQIVQLWSLQDQMTMAQMGLAMDSSIALFKAAMAGDPSLTAMHDGGQASPAFAHAIRSFIEDNLQHALSAEELCTRFKVSRAHLYRMFSEEGGIMRYVQERRLQRCYRALTKMGTATSVVSVATSFGFKSESHFTRAFKTRFGQTPTSAQREGSKQMLTFAGDRALVDSWLRDL